MPQLIICTLILLVSQVAQALTDQAYLAQRDVLDEKIELIISAHGPFEIQLFDPLMQLSKLSIDAGDYETAKDSLQRAQNISHRNEGVYSLKQLEIVDLLTNIALSNAEHKAANKQQRFAFFVATHNLDNDDPEVLFAYMEMAEWFMNTGQTNRARRILQEATELAQDLDQDVLPIAMLASKTRRLQGSCCSPRQMERAVNDVERSDPDTLAAAYLEIADLLTLGRNYRRAADYFQKAHQTSPLVGDSDPIPITAKRTINTVRTTSIETYRVQADMFPSTSRLERMTTEDTLRDLSRKPQWFIFDAGGTHQGFITDDKNETSAPNLGTKLLVGKPILFSEDQLENLLPYRALKKLEEFIIEASFTVTTTGDLEDIEVTESNAPSKLDRLIVETLKKVYYRPALVTGKPVARKVSIEQTFIARFGGV